MRRRIAVVVGLACLVAGSAWAHNMSAAFHFDDRVTVKLRN